MNRNNSLISLKAGSLSIHAGWFDVIVYSLLFALFLNMAFIRNFTDGEPVHGGEFITDNGAYYIYLPATFIHGYSTETYPDSIDMKNRYGFFLDKQKNKVITKVTYGVAFFVAPFYVPAHLIIKACGLPSDGFSVYYHRTVIVAAIFFLILSMWILKQFLRHYLKTWMAYLLPFIILVGTNLYYFSMDQVLYAHLYGFFLVSLLLLTLKRYLDNGMQSFRLFLAIAGILAFLALVRPTNILLISLLAFWDTTSWKEIINRFRHFLRPLYVLSFAGVFLLVFFPQLVYWHFISGKWIYFSYPGEGFTNWDQPMIIPFLFSPLNGWIPYTPLAILFLTGLGLMIVKRISNGLLVTGLFLLFSYVFSSWHSWYFGGSFGCRPLIELYPFFTLSLGYLLMAAQRHRNLLVKVLPWLFIVFCLYFNQRQFDRWLFYTGGTWSWQNYREQLEHAGLACFPGKTYQYINDFENTASMMQSPPTSIVVRSGTQSTFMIENMWVNGYVAWRLKNILKEKVPDQVQASIWIRSQVADSTGALFVCEILDSQKTTVYKLTVEADDYLTVREKWFRIPMDISIPAWIDENVVIAFYVLNPEKQRFYLDDLSVKFE